MRKILIFSSLFFGLTAIAFAQTATPILPPVLTASLYVGVRNDAVRQLQEFLAQYKEVYPEGLITGYFGKITEAAVKKWQTQNGIEAVGIVGPKTRAKLAEIRTQLITDNSQPTAKPAASPTATPIPAAEPSPTPKPVIKTGTGAVAPNRYINFGTGSFLYAGVSPRDKRAFLYAGDPADTVAGVNPITGYSNCEDINELNYVGIKNICEFTDPAKYTFTPHTKPIRFYDKSASNQNVAGSSCYSNILLFKQGGFYGGFDPETMDPDGTLHYRYWYDESGGTNFASLCSSSNTKNSTASLLTSLKSALESLRLLIK